MTFTDQFCGAGGSSQGVRNAAKNIKGLEVKLALNHWQLAIDTHQHNFPDTVHDCTDIQACDPRYYPKTDILITSPECTNHTLAKGQKYVKQMLQLFEDGVIDASAERSRATMWDVCRFAEFHMYKAIIVENVVDARKWIMWDAWIMAMQALGYNHKCVYINSMHCFPTPQSRDRMYVVFWNKKQKAPDLNFAPKTYCHKCNSDTFGRQVWKNKSKPYGKYKAQYYFVCNACNTRVEPYYYAAFNAIDWSDIGTKIGDRKKPLCQKTMERIKYGIKTYSEPSVVTVRYSSGVDYRVKSVHEQLPTQVGDLSQGILMPFIIKGEHTLSGSKSYVKSSIESLNTQSTRQSSAVVFPFITELNSTGKARSVKDSISTVLAGGNHHGLCFMVNNKGQSKVKSISDPLSTITTKPYHGLISNDSWNAFIDSYYGNITQNHILDPIGTIRTKESMNLITYDTPKLEDCYYRMLKPHEVQAAMAFDKDYHILGNSRDKVKQCGNAVTPPVMQWLVERVVKSLDL